jgi:hypothetical protein
MRHHALTAFICSHELEFVYRYAHQVLCLNRRLQCTGPPSEVLTAEAPGPALRPRLNALSSPPPGRRAMIEALTLPFMQRAPLAGLLVGIVASLLGVFVILRQAAFFGDAIAHAPWPASRWACSAGSPRHTGLFLTGIGLALLTYHLLGSATRGRAGP